MSRALVIRAAERSDVPRLFAYVRELAEYERAADRVQGTEELLEQALFGENPVAEAVLAERDGAPAGFALFFRTFSTWLCRSGLWLEDLYVPPEHRRAGIGRALLAHLAELGLERGLGRIEWSALHWNTPAIRFYEQIGAERLHEWGTFRLEGETIARLAREAQTQKQT